MAARRTGRTRNPPAHTAILASLSEAMLVMELDSAGKLLAANPAFAHLHDPALAAPLTGDTRNLFPPALHPDNAALHDAIRQGTLFHGRCCFPDASGQLHWLQVSGFTVAGIHPARYILCCQDVTSERHTAQSTMDRLAYYDPLTTLPHRNLLRDQAAQAIGTQEATGTCLVVLHIALARFRQINTALGREAGDDMLRQVAIRLQAQTRRTDLVGRISGNEFVVVLADCHREYIAPTAERFLQAACTPCLVGDSLVTPSARIGVSIYPDDGRTIDDLLQHAEMALHHARQSGMTKLAFFRPEMHQQTQHRMAMEQALRTALATSALTLHYQPQVQLHDRSLYGVEALARWHHPQWGAVSPEHFVPVAEECGLAAILGRWTLTQACKQMQDWVQRGVAVPTISVNLSASCFQDPALPAFLHTVMQNYAVRADQLALEITETVVLDQHPVTLRNLPEIHAMGLRIVIDDFGTGYSSLSYLARLPVAEIKLDKSFLQHIAHDAASQALASTILRIGSALQLPVIAEGVENRHQLSLLQQQGCDIVQGFVFSAPLAPAALEQWIQEALPATPPAHGQWRYNHGNEHTAHAPPPDPGPA